MQLQRGSQHGDPYVCTAPMVHRSRKVFSVRIFFVKKGQIGGGDGGGGGGADGGDDENAGGGDGSDKGGSNGTPPPGTIPPGGDEAMGGKGSGSDDTGGGPDECGQQRTGAGRTGLASHHGLGLRCRSFSVHARLVVTAVCRGRRRRCPQPRRRQRRRRRHNGWCAYCLFYPYLDHLKPDY